MRPPASLHCHGDGTVLYTRAAEQCQHRCDLHAVVFRGVENQLPDNSIPQLCKVEGCWSQHVLDLLGDPYLSQRAAVCG